MKKYILLMALASLFSVAVSAQDEAPAEESKKEINYPSAGTISIGVDAMPYINFVGNMFNNTAGNTLAVGNTTLYGKYFLSKKQAVRVSLFLNNTKTNDAVYVTDQSQVPIDAAIQVEDVRITSNSGYGIGVGFQEYLGTGRLRAFYGGQVGYALNRLSYEYKWGNEMTLDNTAPTSNNWGTVWGTAANRNLVYDNGQNHTISLGGFVGVEYFINSVLSIGGELGLYAAMNWNTQADYTYQTVNQGSYKEMDQTVAPTGSNYTLNTQLYNVPMTAGNIYFSFYF